MIPRIASGGRSFKGAYQYYGHDKEATTRDRVAWTQTENMITEDPDKAWKVMAYTAMEQSRLKIASGQKATGRKLEKPVFSYSLAWHPEQDPDRDEMLEAARDSLEELGLSDHEALIVAHRDEPHRHVHVVVNRVHPITGIAATISHSRRKLSDFARLYENAQGKVYCKRREENFQKRRKGECTMYKDPVINAAWKASDSGVGFAAALREKEYQLAQGRKRIVVVDARGQIHNPIRHLEGVRAKEFNERIKDLDVAPLPDATEISRQVQERGKEDYRKRQEREEDQAEQINRLQDEHIEQRATVSNRHHRQIEEERTKLADYYKLEEQKKAIRELETKTKRPGLWRRITGKARKDRAQLASLSENLGSAESRFNERITFLEKQRASDLSRLGQRQEKERMLLREHGPEALQAWRDRHKVQRASLDRGRPGPRFGLGR